MTEATQAKIPGHLRKYVVEQNYARYTPQDQAVWRFIMRQLKSFLAEHAHSSYLQGLSKSGLSVERIPRITEVDEHLEKFGWGAVPVSGFIPPAAFMEFQAIGVLPIASDMRTADHLLYTPAPDIVHEAAGHAPILTEPEYAAYLRQYGEIARHSIISKEDMSQYEAIRVLSDIKEDSSSTPADIRASEAALVRINSTLTKTSEAALLSRMNWWTAEYGLIGDMKSPRIYGAGLLSSAGEARACLQSKVKKIPLSVDCVNYAYDITEQQPQLFVSRDFAHLGEVLEQLAGGLAYRKGGAFGLDRAIEAGTVNSVQLNSGIQISGTLANYSKDSKGQPAYLKFEGPSQLATEYTELDGQGVRRHAHGFSSPVGLVKNQSRCLSLFSPADLEKLGLQRGRRAMLEFASGVRVEGQVAGWTYHGNSLVIITWTDCTVTLASQRLFDPAWGEFDMAVGSVVDSVFGGPADRSSFGETDDFVAKVIPPKGYSSAQLERHRFYDKLRDLRQSVPSVDTRAGYDNLLREYLADAKRDWLQGIELLELSFKMKEPAVARAELLQTLAPESFADPAARECVREGVALAQASL